MVGEHSACAGALTDNRIEARGENWELRVGELFTPGDATARTPTNRGEDETKEDVPAAGTAKLPACVASDLGKAAATLPATTCSTVEEHVVACRTDGTLGMVGITAGVMAGVLATNGELTTGTPGNLSGEWGKTDALGATVRWHACSGGPGAPVLGTLAAGTFCGGGLEIMRTWLPGPKPWGGTTKRALLSIICVPPTSRVEVLMIIFCWTVPVAEVDHGVFAGPAAGMFFCILLRASREVEEEGVLSPLPLWLFKIFFAIAGVADVCAGILCMLEND